MPLQSNVSNVDPAQKNTTNHKKCYENKKNKLANAAKSIKK